MIFYHYMLDSLLQEGAYICLIADMEENTSDAYTPPNYFTNNCDIEEVEIECDAEFLAEEELEPLSEVQFYRKRKAFNEEDSSFSQMKRRRLSVIVENTNNFFCLEGEPVTEVFAEYDEKTKEFKHEGQKRDLISMLCSFTKHQGEHVHLDPTMIQNEDDFNLDASDNILEMIKSSPFFLQHKQLVRSCKEESWEKFDKTDPSLPEGFRVRETTRGCGKRVDREFLNKEGTIVLRSKPAVMEYMKVLNNRQ